MNNLDCQQIVIVNFAHPLTQDNHREVEQILSASVATVIERPAHFDWERPFCDQARDLVTQVGLSREDWQRSAVVVNLPGLSSAAALVLAELHGRIGGFPPVLLLRRQGVLNQYRVAEVLDLQALRDVARAERSGDGRNGEDL